MAHAKYYHKYQFQSHKRNERTFSGNNTKIKETELCTQKSIKQNTKKRKEAWKNEMFPIKSSKEQIK